MKTQTTDVIHSSGYARSQNAGNFGSVSSETFSQRQAIQEQRKFVRGYNNSRIIGGGAGVQRAKTYTPPPPKAPPSSSRMAPAPPKR